MPRATQAPIIADPPASVNLTIDGAIESYRRHLRAENKSPATLTAYLGALELFNRFVKERGMPTELVAIRREHLEAFLVDLTERGSSPASVSFYYRSLQPFFKWAVDEDELRESPMARMRPPKVPESPPPVLPEDDLARLLKACDGPRFEDRRDTALLRLLLDTGMRRGEITGLKLDDLDLDQDVAIVMGKGRRQRACPFGTKTARALDRYLRARARHPYAARPELWLGRKGAFRMEWGGAGHPTPGQEGRPQRGAPAPVPPYVRPPVAGRRRQRGRPHAPGRLEEPPDAGPLRRQRRGRAGASGVSVAQPRRPAVEAH